MTSTMTFRTAEQAAIFRLELIGQFSDGHWENSTRGDWETWCDAKITYGERVGRDFHTSYDKYNLSAPALLEVVELRMIGYARLAIRFGYEFACELQYGITCAGTFICLDGHGQERERVEHILAIANVTMDDVFVALRDVRYGRKQLRTDLAEMKKAMKIRKT